MEGLALAADSGVHIFDTRLMWFCALGHLHAGDVAAARIMANQMAALVSGRAKLVDSLYNSLSLGVSLCEGDVARAVQEGLRSVALAKETGAPDRQILALAYSAYAWAKFGDTERALRDIEAARMIDRGVAIPMTTYMCTFIEAAIRRLRGEHQNTLGLLNRALTIGKQFRIAMTPLCCGREDAAQLYNMALEADIERDHVRTLIKQLQLAPPAGVPCEHWPRPIRIRTFGRFCIERDGASAAASRKESRKPLELLKLLVAHGEETVPVARLCDALWPGADGDAGRNSFDNTLHRLRKLLGGDLHVQLRGGGLRLDAATCWTDMAALEACLEEAVSLAPGADAAHVTALAERALALCQGEFLAGEDDLADVLAARARIQAIFTRQMGALGTRLEAVGSHAAAARIYERAIEQQPLAEDIHRRLIACLLALGQRAEAYAAYRRCRQHLSVVLGIRPADETEAMVAPLRNL
jgi:DNA-binding SARP family transcriptional activator